MEPAGGGENDTIGQRLRSLHSGESRLAFARRIGVSDSTLGNYERDERIPDAGFLARLREATGADLNWLIGGTLPRKSATDVTLADGFVPIPRLDIRASAGSGRLAILEDAEAQVVAFKREWLRKLGVSPKDAQIIVAEGDSMEPTISHGDLVLIDRAVDHIVDEGIYVLVYAGMVKLKRIQVLLSGTVLLKSDNPAYQTEEVNVQMMPEQLIIEGRVRWAGGAI